jgi:hypothetical protein
MNGSPNILGEKLQPHNDRTADPTRNVAVTGMSYGEQQMWQKIDFHSDIIPGRHAAQSNASSRTQF